jgi:hypothetical protein
MYKFKKSQTPFLAATGALLGAAIGYATVGAKQVKGKALPSVVVGAAAGTAGLLLSEHFMARKPAA